MLLPALSPTPKTETKIVELKAANGDCGIRWAVKVCASIQIILNKWNTLKRSQQRDYHSWPQKILDSYPYKLFPWVLGSIYKRQSWIRLNIPRYF